MVILDLSVVNIALPQIRAGLHFSTTGLQWAVSAYTLTFAGLLLLGGRAADLLGRKRRMLDGLPEHRDSVHTAPEAAANDLLMVYVSRALSERLVLDI